MELRAFALGTHLDHRFVAHASDGPVHINCMFRKPLDPTAEQSPHPWQDDGPYCHIVQHLGETTWQAPSHQRAVLVIGDISDVEISLETKAQKMKMILKMISSLRTL